MVTESPTVSIYHTILWSKYKGLVFSHVNSESVSHGLTTRFIQIAETLSGRVALGGVDLTYHDYPYFLMFPGAYDKTPLYRRVLALSIHVLRNPCDLVVLPGYERIEYWAMLLMCILLRRRRAVFCDSTAYDRPKRFWKELAKRIFFQRSDGFFCYGVRSKEYVASYGIKQQKIIFPCQAAALPHGYDRSAVSNFYAQHAATTVDSVTFLFVGRLAVEKGLDDLLHAFVETLKTLPSARLEFVGAGPLQHHLVKRVSELGLDPLVTFHGSMPLEQIGELFMRSTAMVLPSHSEPWGLVVNEALSYGCPVVVSNVCGCVPELVVEGRTGYSFTAGNVRELGDAMMAVAHMPADRATVAAQCLDLIAQYTPARAAARIVEGCIQILQT